VSIDGGMVIVRGGGRKEVTVGAIFDVEQPPESDPITGEWVEEAHGENVGYAAVRRGLWRWKRMCPRLLIAA